MNAVKITDRDKRIFHFIYDNLFAKVCHIQSAQFPQGTYVTTQNRISQLVKAGYLRKLHWDSVLLFRLTRKALSIILNKEEDIDKYQRRKIAKNQITHDIKLIHTKIILEKASILSRSVPAIHLAQYKYLEDNRIKVPDAVYNLSFEGRDLKAAIELELTQKTSKRYLNVFEKYYTKIKVDLVLYIVESEGLKRTLLKLGAKKLKELSERKITKENKLYVTTLDEINQKGLCAYFEGLFNQGFTLQDLQDCALKPQVLPQESHLGQNLGWESNVKSN